MKKNAADLEARIEHLELEVKSAALLFQTHAAVLLRLVAETRELVAVARIHTQALQRLGAPMPELEGPQPPAGAGVN